MTLHEVLKRYPGIDEQAALAIWQAACGECHGNYREAIAGIGVPFDPFVGTWQDAVRQAITDARANGITDAWAVVQAVIEAEFGEKIERDMTALHTFLRSLRADGVPGTRDYNRGFGDGLVRMAREIADEFGADANIPKSPSLVPPRGIAHRCAHAISEKIAERVKGVIE